VSSQPQRIAGRYEISPLTRLTDTGRIIGSRDYMAPEQFHGTPVTPRSDLYAVGCLLHEMLTGGRVFDGTSDAALQHVHDRPPPVRQRRPDISPDIERLVLDLLAKAPDDRPSPPPGTTTIADPLDAAELL
jgi:eukaryotic-like serine/threonine-protein kinase